MNFRGNTGGLFLTGDFLHDDVRESGQRRFGLVLVQVASLRNGVNYRRLPQVN